MTKNVKLLSWVDEMAALTKPENIMWIDGSQEQLEALRKEAMDTQGKEAPWQQMIPKKLLQQNKHTRYR